jgi:hypothetical protein
VGIKKGWVRGEWGGYKNSGISTASRLTALNCPEAGGAGRFASKQGASARLMLWQQVAGMSFFIRNFFLLYKLLFFPSSAAGWSCLSTFPFVP